MKLGGWIAWAYSVSPIAAIISPFFLGMIADAIAAGTVNTAGTWHDADVFFVSVAFRMSDGSVSAASVASGPFAGSGAAGGMEGAGSVAGTHLRGLLAGELMRGGAF